VRTVRTLIPRAISGTELILVDTIPTEKTVYLCVSARNPAERLPLRTPQRQMGGTCHTLLPPLSMTSDATNLGRCPECGESIPAAWLLVEYEKDDGETGIWAECPACEDVVEPE
jgi:hypothetical protein